MSRQIPILLVVMASLLASPAWATEICGNSMDDDANGSTDEGCAPTLTSDICESPLSCMETGMVSWSTGSLHYDLPPDISPKVPYGPGIGFRRFYTSMSTPGTNPTSVNKKPLGDHWQHTYLTYVYRYLGGDSVYRVVLHTNDGRDILFTYASTASGWETYTPQAGFPVMSLKRNTSSPNEYRLQLLTGEMLVYNSSGQIIEEWDNLQPTPNKVLITWDSTTNGNVSTVTDANGKRRLRMNYSSDKLTSVEFQTFASSTWTTQHTTSYDYTISGVTRDATSGWYVPASATEWGYLLEGTGIANPGNLWLSQESSGSLADSIGSASLAPSTNPLYQQTVSGWSRKAVGANDGNGGQGFITGSVGDIGTTSGLLLSFVAITQTPAGERSVLGLGASVSHRYAAVTTSPVYKATGLGGSGSATGTQNPGTGVHIVALQVDRTHSKTTTFTDQGDVLTPTWTDPWLSSDLLVVGDASVGSAPSRYLYSVFWSGTGAEMSETQVSTLMTRLKSGPGLTGVTIGGQLAQRMVYDESGLLARLTDASGNQIATFAYSSTTTGQVNAISTPRGTVGFEFNSSRTGCTGGKTALYFNKASATSCSVDGDCGGGMMCGGKTGSGSTGTCFYAARCLTLSTSFNESVVTAVAPIGAGGGSCAGACTDVAAYVWNTSPSNVIRAIGTQDPLGNYTSATYNSDGLPTRIAYGDTNSDATDGGYQRTVFFYYDSTFPGRLSEVRRKSDLDASASSCSISSSTGCARTLYSYDATSKQLASVSLSGTTLDTSGSPTSFTSTTTYSLDSKARVTQIDGAVSPMKTTFSYVDSSDPYTDEFLDYTRMYSDGTNYLQTSVLAYDFWGNPTGVTTPDGTVTCVAYDSARGFLSSRREAMNGQTTCATSNGADLTTTWARDSALRITQLTRPDGSCMFWEYDSNGRLARTKRRDDCNAGSSGDKEEYLYNSEGLLYEIDTYNASSAITRKRLMSYHASRRLAGITNPVDITKSRDLVYDATGMVEEVVHEGSLGKTEYTMSADRRITAETRYKDASNSDTWQLLFDWLGNQKKVTDADSKETETVRDDAGRIVKIVSADTSYPTLRVYDAADRVTTIKEAFGGGGDNEKTHTFTYDALSRPLADDYHGICTTGTPHAEIIRVYDSASGCPGTCSALAGKLAKVTTSLLCASTYSGTDGSLDQATWFSYDDAGRASDEYTSDDASRTANQSFLWTKNGALAQVNTPSGVEMIWSFGSGGSNSDTDRITKVSRISTSTPVIENVSWYPYGPLSGYDWLATKSSSALSTSITRNLAYRPSYVGNGNYSSNVLFGVTLDEDAKGRVTERIYSSNASGTSGVTDSYFLYDHQDRVTCETTAYQSSCPTSGSGLKNNLSSFTDAGDWETLYRPIPGSTGFTNTFNPSGYGSSHQVTLIRQNAGSPTLGDTELGYDARGNRTYDDNTTSLTYDRRDYTYDARGNVVNVAGKYWSTTAVPAQWVDYDVASAFDARNRRVYKSFYDNLSGKTATWFFYYDPYDRLTEVRYTPDTSASSTYQLFQLFWVGERLALYWQTDQSGSTTSKRYVASDETGRPLGLWTWPSSGDPERSWAVNPSAWGFDTNVAGSTVFQPSLFGRQNIDQDTASYHNDHTTIVRTGLAVDEVRMFDPFSGGYLSVETDMRTPYIYQSSCPVYSPLTDEIDNPTADRGAAVSFSLPEPAEVITTEKYYVDFHHDSGKRCDPIDSGLWNTGELEFIDNLTSDPGPRSWLSVVSPPLDCRPLGGYFPVVVTCVTTCGGLFQNCAVTDYGPWDGYHFGPNELGSYVPGVHLAETYVISSCSCSCGLNLSTDPPCCRTGGSPDPHGGGDDRPPVIQ